MLFPTVRSSLTGDESPFCVKFPSALQPTRICPRRSSFHSHIGLNEIKKNSKLWGSERKASLCAPPHFYDLKLEFSKCLLHICVSLMLTESFRVFSGRDESSESQLTGWDKYCGRLAFRKGKYEWFVTLINFKHSNRNTIWNRIQRGNRPSKFNSGDWKTVIEFPS